MNINKRMRTEFHCCIASTPLIDVSIMLDQSNLDCVVVEDDDGFSKGVIAKSDIDDVEKLNGHINFVASDVINTKGSHICWEQDDVKIAVSIMIDRHMTSLPVVNNRFCVVGIIMMSDVLLLHKNSRLPVENVSYHV